MSAETAADESVEELLVQYGERARSPLEVIAACAARVESGNTLLNAGLTLALDGALDAARASEARWLRGRPLPLDGVPFGAKDVIDTAGIATSYGTARWRDHRPLRDATVVSRLREAGAIPLLKTQTNELVAGSVRNVHHGLVRNPWSIDHMAGGSSSGSAASVAARWIPFALATDAGGSIRCPASYCGVTGLKTTHASLPLDGILVSTRSTDTVGPMARSAIDAARIHSVLTGSPVQLDDSSAARRTRVAIPRAWCFEGCDATVRTAVEEALETLRGMGASVQEVAFPLGDLAWSAGWVILLVENFACLGEYLELQLSDPSADQEFIERMASGMLFSAMDYERALEVRDAATRELEALFGQFDVLAMPTTPSVAFAENVSVVQSGKRELSRIEASTRLTMLASVTGMPAVTVPCGLDKGLPVGLQLIGRKGAEQELLAVAAGYQRRTPHHLMRPPRAA